MENHLFVGEHGHPQGHFLIHVTILPGSVPIEVILKHPGDVPPGSSPGPCSTAASLGVSPRRQH